MNNYLKKTGILFFLAILFDCGSMMLNDLLRAGFHKSYLIAPIIDYTRTTIYFTGQSLSRLFYIWTILIYTKEYFIINIICAMWFGFACNDSLEELFFDNTKFDITEYIVFGISIPLIAWKIYRYKKQNRRNNSY